MHLWALVVLEFDARLVFFFGSVCDAVDKDTMSISCRCIEYFARRCCSGSSCLALVITLHF